MYYKATAILVGTCLFPSLLLAQEDKAPDSEKDEDLWSTEAELGISTSSGNTDATSGTARIASDREGDRFGVHLLAEGRYATEDGEATTQRAHGSTQVNYNFRPRVYAFGVVESTHDRFAEIDVRLRESVGLGRRFFLNHADLAWRIEGGPASRQEWRRDGSFDHSMDGRARTLFTWEFSENGTFTQEVTWTHSLEDEDDFLGASATSVRFRLNTNLAFKTSVRIEHDSQPAPATERTDIFTTTSLIYSF